eukprot:TRINITY_DN1742_c0_g1_i1.p1 TRINITY_DN1742_c0_g1~~TRINITY_DN1742_c0_g1_i1.p1  ORF type:complete len:753 (+),score=146.81 TRINITY_DN1742_c0_g1_i1:42-2300(+)
MDFNFNFNVNSSDYTPDEDSYNRDFRNDFFIEESFSSFSVDSSNDSSYDFIVEGTSSESGYPTYISPPGSPLGSRQGYPQGYYAPPGSPPVYYAPPGSPNGYYAPPGSPNGYSPPGNMASPVSRNKAFRIMNSDLSENLYYSSVGTNDVDVNVLRTFFRRYLPGEPIAMLSENQMRELKDVGTELFLGNISDATSIEYLKACLLRFGKIRSLALAVDVKKNVHKNFGFIEYKKEKDARRLYFYVNILRYVQIDNNQIKCQIRQRKQKTKVKRQVTKHYRVLEARIGYYSFKEIENELNWADVDSESDSLDETSSTRSMVFYTKKIYPGKSVMFDYTKKQLEVCIESKILLFAFHGVKIHLLNSGMVIRFYYNPSVGQYKEYMEEFSYDHRFERQTRDTELENVTSIYLELPQNIVTGISRNAQFTRIFGMLQNFPLLFEDMTDIELENFAGQFDHQVFFGIKMLWSCNLIYPQDLEDFLLHILGHEDHKRVRCALDQMWDPQKTEPFSNPIDTFDKNYHYAKPLEFSSENLMMINKIIVTPTRFYFIRPTLEATNNAIRTHKKFSDRFIRVSFTDEDFSSLKSLQSNENADLINRLRDVMMNGIQVGNQNYQFLGYSSSQLKTGDCWFFNITDSPVTISGLIKGFGDFSKIHIVGKYAARIGQKFSTTKHGRELDQGQIIMIPDITTDDGKYTFSDGIGQISKELAIKVSKKLSYDLVPSAFQIRLGGCKGVLAVNPDMAQESVLIRPIRDL